MRKALVIWIALAATIIAIEACAVLDSKHRALKPEGPHFDHKYHLGRGIDCSDCHGEEDQEWKAMPTLESCNECHEDIDGEKPHEQRASAFYDTEGKGKWVRATALASEVVFSHSAHLQKSQDCTTCHQDVAESTFISADLALDMAECIDCHERQAPQQNDCASCHREIRKDRAPPSHRLGWTTQHGRVARMGGFDPLPEQCSICHTRSSCDGCHKAEPPRNHTNLFRLRGHAASASIDRDRCFVCHRTDSCVLCHQSALPRSHRGAWRAPFNRHCFGCHLPLEQFGEEGCAVCHRATPSHDMAPPRPGNPVHMTMSLAACRACHTPMPHPDNGQSCLICHK